LKFGDVVMAVASIAVVFALIFAPLDLVFVSALGLELGYDVSNIVALFLSALIGGYIFAGKIWEARREAITKIAVLWGALMEVFALIVPASLAHWGLWIVEAYKGEYGATLSTYEWVKWEMMLQDIVVFMAVGMALVFGFVGLYIGSMLRRPAKKGK